jgi:hypothetical protein
LVPNSDISEFGPSVRNAGTPAFRPSTTFFLIAGAASRGYTRQARARPPGHPPPLFNQPHVKTRGGEKRPGITRSDLLVVNKIDLAPLVGADLGVMENDTRRMHGSRPYVFANLRGEVGTAEIAGFIETFGDHAPDA